MTFKPKPENLVDDVFGSKQSSGEQKYPELGLKIERRLSKDSGTFKDYNQFSLNMRTGFDVSLTNPKQFDSPSPRSMSISQ